MNLEVELVLAVSAVVLVGAGSVLHFRSRQREKRDRERLEAAMKGGFQHPPSLHPVISPDLCIGSLACVAACPEGDVLGIVDGVGTLVMGANCIGHGRCAAECPVGAIQLVFGTSERGVDIPRVSPHFESNVPGIFIAGELGGMGLIKNAVRQGTAAMRRIIETLPSASDPERDDVIVIGAGPAGFAAGLAAMEAGLRFRIIEQDTFGGTVAHYPRQKIVMSEAVEFPLAGKVLRGNLSKEDLIGRMAAIRQERGLPIQEGERAEDIQGSDGDFSVITDRGKYSARKIVLAIGRRGTPRRLGIPGENLPSVTYRLIEPEQYARRPVLVVGGGDSAVEAACALAEAGADVALSHRRSVFDRCKPANRERITNLGSAGRVRLLLCTAPARFEPQDVILAAVGDGEALSAVSQRLPAEFVVICAGGELPTALLSRIGIQVDRHYGEPA